jgi:hypothetical protein
MPPKAKASSGNSKNSVFPVREGEYFFKFHSQSPKTDTLATIIYLERST